MFFNMKKKKKKKKKKGRGAVNDVGSEYMWCNTGIALAYSIVLVIDTHCTQFYRSRHLSVTKSDGEAAYSFYILLRDLRMPIIEGLA